MTIKNVLITGCNRGIGLELCKQLIALNTTQHVIATARQPQNAIQLNQLSESSEKLDVLLLDTNDYQNYNSLFDKVSQIVNNDGINCLINNAGIISRDSLQTVTADHLMDTFQTNTVSPLMLTRSLLPLLRMCSDKSEPTSVVNISSILGTFPIKAVNGQQWYPYRISKTGLNMVTKLLAFDLNEFKIKVIAIHPGWVKTDMGTQSALLDTHFSVESIIKVISKIDDNMNGKLINFDGKILEY